MPVLRVLGSQQTQDLRDDGIAPTPISPVVKVVHLLALVGQEGENVPEKVRNEEAHSHVVEEVRAIALESAAVEVSVLPVNVQWLSKAEHEAVKWIILLFLNNLHLFLNCLVLILELKPINLILGSSLLLIFHLHFDIIIK